MAATTDCSFQCALALLRDHGMTVLADRRAVTGPLDNLDHILSFVVVTQPELRDRVCNWSEYLTRLRNGQLFGGDVEIGALFRNVNQFIDIIFALQTRILRTRGTPSKSVVGSVAG